MQRWGYADVWGDTVKLDHLCWGIVIGVVLGITSYSLGFRYFSSHLTVQPELIKSYSLLMGIVGCIVSAVISAMLFKPKRVVQVDSTGWEEERSKVLLELQIDPGEEREYLKEVEPEIQKEIQELGLEQVLLQGKKER